MDEQTVLIREFGPEHLDAVVALHQQCFSADTSLSTRLGARFLRTTYTFFLRDSKAFGFVALREGNPVGFLCGRLDFFVGALNRYRAPVAALALLGRPRLLFEMAFRKGLVKAVTSFTARRKTEERKSTSVRREGAMATLASLGVLPDYAHLHVSDKLLSTAESLSRKNQMRFVRACVRRANLSSRFLYRKRGYVEDPGKPADDELFYYLSLADEA